MRIVWCILFLFSFGITHAQTVKSIRAEVTKMIKDEDLKNASIGFYAWDLDSNKIISGRSSSRSLVPASTMKLVTTATALEMMGSGRRFKTTIKYSGEIDTNCTLNGDIYIVGGGDPCLGSHRYIKHYGDFIGKWAEEIVKLGIDSINGRVIGDATIFSEQMIPSTWIWGDLGNYYGSGPCGLSIYENLCRLTLASGSRGDSAVISCVNPYIPGLSFDNYVKSMSTTKDQSYIFGAPYQADRVIKGGIPTNQKEFEVKASVPDPAYLAAFDLDMELRGIGVKLARPYTTVRRLGWDRKTLSAIDKKVITTKWSPRLSAIIQSINHYSVNLYAEHLMNQIGLHKYGSGDTGSGSVATTKFWEEKELDVAGLYVNDGSGLSRFNAITAKQLVGILQYMYSSKNYEIFYNSLAVSGKSGTLRSIGRGTAATGRIHAKSGYMTRVRSYAGYVKTKNRRNIAFAIIVNNFNCSPLQMKKKMEKIMVEMAELNE